ncbi:hypothetical protein ACFV3E_42320 [Streptomyces sp. NPDC059718]
MIYDLMTVGGPEPALMAVAIAAVVGVAVDDVDLGHVDADPDGRAWDSLVVCTYGQRSGDVTWALEIYVRDEVRDQPSERDFSQKLAFELRTAILFSAEGVRPSAYWVATPEGVTARVRLYESHDDPSRHFIDLVEASIPELPHVSVARIPEAVSDLVVETPVTDTFKECLASLRGPRRPIELGTPEFRVSDAMGAWEMMIRMMSDDWRPAGWYPEGLYRQRLEARDEIGRSALELPEEARELVGQSLQALDDAFRRLTVEDVECVVIRTLKGQCAVGENLGWWWSRRPEPLPWL